MRWLLEEAPQEYLDGWILHFDVYPPLAYINSYGFGLNCLIQTHAEKGKPRPLITDFIHWWRKKPTAEEAQESARRSADMLRTMAWQARGQSNGD